MARYLQVAAEANEVAKYLFELTTQPNNLAPEAYQAEVAECITRLYNFGIRTAPRAVQSTVRLNAVKAAVASLPVTVSMQPRTGDNGRTYNALITKTKVGTAEE